MTLLLPPPAAHPVSSPARLLMLARVHNDRYPCPPNQMEFCCNWTAAGIHVEIYGNSILIKSSQEHPPDSLEANQSSMKLAKNTSRRSMQDSLVLSLLKISIDTLALIYCFFLRAIEVIALTIIYQEVPGGHSAPVNMAARKSFNIIVWAQLCPVLSCLLVDAVFLKKIGIILLRFFLRSRRCERGNLLFLTQLHHKRNNININSNSKTSRLQLVVRYKRNNININSNSKTSRSVIKDCNVLEQETITGIEGAILFCKIRLL
jgi:hypothetical protein